MAKPKSPSNLSLPAAERGAAGILAILGPGTLTALVSEMIRERVDRMAPGAWTRIAAAAIAADQDPTQAAADATVIALGLSPLPTQAPSTTQPQPIHVPRTPHASEALSEDDILARANAKLNASRKQGGAT